MRRVKGELVKVLLRKLHAYAVGKLQMKCRASSEKVIPPRVRGQFEMSSRRALSQSLGD
jgi:hypothetical protein